MRKRLSFLALLPANYRYKNIVFPLVVFSIAFILLLSTNVFAVNEWQEGTGEDSILGTISPSDIDKDSFENIVDPLDRLLADYQEGAKISYVSASALSVSAGQIVCDNAGRTVRKFRENTSATSVTFSDLDTGVESSSTTYYVYGVADTAATTFTFKISTSSTAPSGITYYKKLGSFYNDASSNITQITDDSDNDSAYVKGQGNYYKTDSGTATIGANTSSAISFSFTYTSAPYVVVTYTGDLSLDEHGTISVTPATTTFTLYNNRSIARNFNWIAIGQVLTQ